ncbi:hypothetical protein GCM10009093_25600 [Brevundimonas terrae]|uniref:DUF4288 domain-containing protein n=1 Tax=Brevundimonas terrae TaxID=363631 RepID=A0ABP3ID10_9CAUL|nr:hypothetical protein [Brevundimonas terrae]NIJ27473.1 hypothetical protein [Brevundimonas terrae]
MPKYWISFRVAEVGNHQERRDSIYDAIETLPASSNLWEEPTSFAAFATSENRISAVAQKLTAGLDSETDVLIIRKIDFKQTRVFGVYGDGEKLASLFEGIEAI